MWEALLGAGTKLLGGLMGSSAARDANAQQMQIANANIDLQREFAQSGIQWRAEDARKAGINPLAALGAQLHNFSPISVGTTADTSMASAVSSMGQDIGRAVNATRAAPERAAALDLTKTQLEGAKLDNDLKRTTLASSMQRLKQQQNPPLPTTEKVTDYKMFGRDIKANPSFSDAQKIQNRLGEPAEWPYFPVVAAADAWNNLPSGADWWKSTDVYAAGQAMMRDQPRKTWRLRMPGRSTMGRW